uniref:SH3 domain-binding protein 5-like n=1 Tax=Strigamia maritima TaxID=126957 RepID=T1JFE9_STRMM
MSKLAKLRRNSKEIDVDADDYVDPRVQVELEQLNNATDAINRLEVELDEARAAYRHFLSESSQRFKFLASRLGNCIEKAQPYYSARLRAKESHIATQEAALKFERANSAHCAAKEMVFHAEEGLIKNGMPFDSTWQEMLNHATEKVNEAERERAVSKQIHRIKSQSYVEAEKDVQSLQKKLKSAISKSKPYYEMKAEFNQIMERQKHRVQALEKEITTVKQSYSDALNNLEEISIEIHRQRQQKMERQSLGSRGSGVGAESPTRPSPHDLPNPPTDFNDVYLNLPYKVTSNRKSKICSPQENAQESPTDPSQDAPPNKPITRVDNACQTENVDISAPLLSDHKHHSDRVSAWVRDSGLRMLAAARSASLKSGPDAAQAAMLADMLLTATEESDRSDVESLNSTDVLTDEQIAHLMLDKNMEDVYPDFALVKKDVDEKSSVKDVHTPDSLVQSETSSSSRCKTPSGTSASSTGKSSEYKVVAVQFTVQETVMTPKLARKNQSKKN